VHRAVRPKVAGNISRQVKPVTTAITRKITSIFLKKQGYEVDVRNDLYASEEVAALKTWRVSLSEFRNDYC
jgi:hypothetical protein